MNDEQIIDHIVNTRADIASIKTTLQETLRPLVTKVEVNETRLGAVESDVKIYKRIFLGLWVALVAGVTWAVGWFK